MAAAPRGYRNAPTLGNPARTEAWALLEAARAMEETKTKSREEFLDAVRKNWRLWTIFQASLLEEDCQMPAEPRRNLLGLADLIDRQTVLILSDPTPDKVTQLININRQIGEGLLEGSRKTVSTSQSLPPAVNSLRESA